MIFRDICLPILLVIALGWALDRRFQIDLKSLVKLNLYAFVPAFIFTRVASSDLSGSTSGLVVAFTLSVILIMAGLSTLTSRLLRSGPGERTSMQLGTMFYNCGNWGIPLMALAYPIEGPVIQVFVLMTMNISVFTIGIFLAGSQEGSSSDRWWSRWLPILRQPSIYAVGFGLIMREVGNPVADLPWLWAPFNYLADALVAFALITLGVQLSKTKPPRIIGPLAWALGIRLIGGPLIATGLTFLFGFEGDIAAVLILGSAAPTAVNSALIAMEFNADSRFAAAIVFYSTLLASIVVIGLLMILRTGWVPWVAV